MDDAATNLAPTAPIYTIYRKYPNRTKKDLLLTSNNIDEVNKLVESHDWDDTYETIVYKDGMVVERGK